MPNWKSREMSLKKSNSRLCSNFGAQEILLESWRIIETAMTASLTGSLEWQGQTSMELKIRIDCSESNCKGQVGITLQTYAFEIYADKKTSKVQYFLTLSGLSMSFSEKGKVSWLSWISLKSVPLLQGNTRDQITTVYWTLALWTRDKNTKIQTNKHLKKE